MFLIEAKDICKLFSLVILSHYKLQEEAIKIFGPNDQGIDIVRLWFIDL